MGGHPIVWAFGAVLAGVVTCEATGGNVLPWACAAVVLGALTAVALRRRRFVAATALSSLVAIGGMTAALHPIPRPVRPPCGGHETRWQGMVDAPIERDVSASTGRVTERTVLRLIAQRCDGRWQSARGRVAVGLWDGPSVGRGDRIEVRMRVEPFAPSRNPVDRDPIELARGRDLNGRGWVRSTHAVRQWGRGPMGWIDRARRRASLTLERSAGDVAPLIKALGLGDRASIDGNRRDRWARAGLAHLLAISGLHVGLVMAGLLVLLSMALGLLPGAAERFSVRRSSAGLSIAFVVAFCLWTGGSASTVRATAMAVAYLGGRALGRPAASLNALGIAGVGMLLLDPAALHDVGFLLSFAAVAALLVTPRLFDVDARASRLWRYATASIAASVVATLATAPIAATAFGQVSVVAPLANLVAIPLAAGLATPLAVVAAAWAGCASSLPAVLSLPLIALLQLTDWLATEVGGWPLATVIVPPPTAGQICGYLFALAGAIAWLRYRRRGFGAACAAGMVFLAAATVPAAAEQEPRLTVIHPYVGQGDAALVVLPNDELVVFDAGGAVAPDGWDPGRAVMGPWLRRMGRSTIDLAIISHAHPDHYGGFDFLSRNFEIRELWLSDAVPQPEALRRIVARIEDAGGRVRAIRDLPQETQRGGARLEIAHPREVRGLGLNDGSLVLRIVFGERSTLLPGDIETAAETQIVPHLSAVDILKAPHHGSRTSSTGMFLDAAAPKVAVISCGYRNSFGLPDAEVLRRYRQRGIVVLRTDDDGAVTMQTDGQRWELATHRGRAFTIGR